MRNTVVLSITMLLMLLPTVGCNSERPLNNETSTNKKIDVVFVGPTKNTSGFKKASIDAKTHYDFIRSAEKAEEAKDYDRAIKLLNEALPSAKFKFERGAIYMNLAEIYVAKNDLTNEMKYRLLLSENTGNENLKQDSLYRAEEIRKILESNKA